MWGTTTGDTWKWCGHFLPRALEFLEFSEFLDATSFPVTSFSWLLHDSDSGISHDSWLLSVAAGFSATSTINPPRYASFSLPWEVDAASGYSESGEFFPLEFHRFPVDSIQFSVQWRDSISHLILLSHALTGSVLIPPRHSTESEKTYVFAVASWTALSVNRVVVIPINYSLVTDHLLSHLKQLSQWFLVLILGRSQFLRISVPRWSAAWRVTDRNIPHMAAFTSKSFILSFGLRPYLCLTIEKTFFMCGTQSVDIWRLCGQDLSSPSVSQFPEATSLLVVCESSGKLWCSWPSSVATSLLALKTRTASFCHP